MKKYKFFFAIAALLVPLFSLAQNKAFDRARWPDETATNGLYACKCSRSGRGDSRMKCDCVTDVEEQRRRRDKAYFEMNDFLESMKPDKTTPAIHPITWENPNEHQKAWMEKAKNIKLIGR